MSVVSITKEGPVKDSNGKPRSGYMTTSELARLCGVSRFTIINWTKQGKIKAIRTAGKHYRIPVSEALSLLKTFSKRKKPLTTDLEQPQQQAPITNSDEESENRTTDSEECGNCVTGNEKDKTLATKKKNILYTFGYGLGRGVHVLKGRSKVK